VRARQRAPAKADKKFSWRDKSRRENAAPQVARYLFIRRVAANHVLPAGVSLRALALPSTMSLVLRQRREQMALAKTASEVISSQDTMIQRGS